MRFLYYFARKMPTFLKEYIQLLMAFLSFLSIRRFSMEIPGYGYDSHT